MTYKIYLVHFQLHVHEIRKYTLNPIMYTYDSTAMDEKTCLE